MTRELAIHLHTSPKSLAGVALVVFQQEFSQNQTKIGTEILVKSLLFHTKFQPTISHQPQFNQG